MLHSYLFKASEFIREFCIWRQRHVVSHSCELVQLNSLGKKYLAHRACAVETSTD